MSQPMSIADSPVEAAGELDRLIEEITARANAGDVVDLESYAQKYPQHAGRLRQLLPAIQTLADLGLSFSGGRSSGVPAAGAGPTAGVLGDYRILREIGRGGMGVVYEAEQISLRRRVALKVLPFAAILDPRHLQRFKNEAQAAASLRHPNIVQVFSVGCERGVHYYAMDYVEGQTLAEVIAGLRQGSGVRGQGKAEGGRGKGGKRMWVWTQDPRRPPSAFHRPPHPLTPSPRHPLTLPRPPRSPSSPPKAPPVPPSSSAPWPGWGSRRPRPWNTPIRWAWSTATSSRRT